MALSVLDKLVKDSGGVVENLSPTGFKGKEKLGVEEHTRGWIDNLNESIKLNQKRLSLWRNHPSVAKEKDVKKKNTAVEEELKIMLGKEPKKAVAPPDINDLCKFNGGAGLYRLVLKKSNVYIPFDTKADAGKGNELAFRDLPVADGLEKIIGLMEQIVSVIEDGSMKKQIQKWFDDKEKKEKEAKETADRNKAERESLNMDAKEYAAYKKKQKKMKDKS